MNVGKHEACRDAPGRRSGSATPKRVGEIRISVSLWVSFLAAPTIAFVMCLPARAQSLSALQERYASMQNQLETSPFRRPLVLKSMDSASEPHGDVYAVIDYPFRKVGASLQSPGSWCSILLLQSNIKRCVPQADGAAQTLDVAIGRKFDQPAQDAYQVTFKFNAGVAGGNYLAAQMTAASGPVGTRDYKLALEAVPLEGNRSFIHMSYAYTNGFAARLATDVYLATAGRNKVGFSVARKGEAGRPVLVDGIRGVAERNTMRYFLAIETFLAMPAEQQADQRLRDWFAATERYPRQLHEMDLDQYLDSKRRSAEP